MIVILIVLVLIAIWCISTVNGFKKKEIRVQEGLSGVEVALTKRYDMLTKMLDTAKGYMAHENELFAKVIKLRRGMSVAEMNAAQQQMDNFAPVMSLWNCSVVSEMRRNTCKRPGDCIIPASQLTIQPLLCSRQNCLPAVVSRRNSSLRTKQRNQM